jgi:hypothetical protein
MGKPERIFGHKINVKYAHFSHHHESILYSETEMAKEFDNSYTPLMPAFTWLHASILGAPLSCEGRSFRSWCLGPENFHNAYFLNEPTQVELIQHHAGLIGELGVLGDVLGETNQSSVLPTSDHVVSWLKGAAKLGDRLAQYELFHRFKNGLGAVKNEAETEHWMRQYILNTLIYDGQSGSLTDVADTYKDGRLVQQDLVIAYLLFTLYSACYPRDHEDGDFVHLEKSIYDLERQLSIDEVFAAHTVKEEMIQRYRHGSFHGHNLEGPPHGDGWCPYCAGECNEVNDTKERVAGLMRDKGHVKSMLIKAKSHMEIAASLEGDERSRELLVAFFESKVASILGRRRFLEQGASVSLAGKNGASDELLDANLNISTLDRNLVMHPSYNDHCQRAEIAASEIVNGYNPENLTRSYLESVKYRAYPWGNGEWE